jgi:serine protease Do
MNAHSAAQSVFQVRANGSYLGLQLNEVDADRAKSLNMPEVAGVEILAVQEGAAGDRAGLRPNDVILDYNGEKVLGAEQFIRLVRETPPGRKVKVVYWRAGGSHEMVVITGAPKQIVIVDEFTPSPQILDVPTPLMIWRNVILGIETEGLNDQLAETFGVKQGIMIRSVYPASPAQKAGLKAGDILTGFCGRSLNSPRELGQILRETENPQKPLLVQLMRDHKTLTISVPAEARR